MTGRVVLQFLGTSGFAVTTGTGRRVVIDPLVAGMAMDVPPPDLPDLPTDGGLP